MAQDARKSELIAELARSREALTANVRGLGNDLNLVRRIETAFQRHRFAWLGGATLLGVIIAKLPARTKKVVVDRQGRKQSTEEKAVKAGLLITVLKIAFDIARPALTKWVAQRVAAYADDRFGGAPRA
jgi:hypothetical protein